MAWYVVLIGDVNATTTGNVTAEVQQFKNASDYQNTTGADPSNVLPDHWQGSGGFSTKAAAQKVAERFNKLPADQRSTGGKPLAPNLATPELKTAGNNPLSGLAAIGDFFSRLTRMRYCTTRSARRRRRSRRWCRSDGGVDRALAHRWRGDLRERVDSQPEAS
jgi:hypothetical protein